MLGFIKKQIEKGDPITIVEKYRINIIFSDKNNVSFSGAPCSRGEWVVYRRFLKWWYCSDSELYAYKYDNGTYHLRRSDIVRFEITKYMA